MHWFTVSKISDNREVTPEGFILVRGVPVARTGVQLYRDNEIPDLQADADGWLSIDREPSEVFHPLSLASFQGKPIVDNHPLMPVTPDNYSNLAIGHVTDPRRGTGDQADLLLCDLLFTTARGIGVLQRGKKALSVGYDAFYSQVAPGRGRQQKIVANHIALVDEGRCGSRCSVLDGRALHCYDAQDGKAIEPGCSACPGDSISELTPAVTPLRPGWHEDIDYPRHACIDWGDAGWVESEHPRGQPENAGQFVEGGGGKAGPATSLMPEFTDYSKPEARALGDKIAEQVGAGEYVKAARAKLDAKGDDYSTLKEHMDPATNALTPERAALHQQIIDRLFSDEAILRAKPKPGQKPVMTMLGGRGGSGKSWLSNSKKGGPINKDNAILVDADEFKKELGMEGWDAGHYHDESDKLVSRAAEEARRLGINVIHDATLKSTDSALERMAAYKQAGFDVDGYYMHLPPEMATKRAMERYARGMEENGKGRFVPPEVILANKNNERNFDAMLPEFRHWGVWENTGSAPNYVAGSEQTEKRYGGQKRGRPGGKARAA